MIKVLVVDDDYLVLRGFIALMPWSKHGFEVVGEARNGVEALQLLGEREVDLLITDLMMPSMPGIELMKRAKASYPMLQMVVLTFHHEFDLAQEAIRLGALDFITKVELEPEKMDEVLKRIAVRIRERQPITGNPQSAYGSRQRYISADCPCVLVSLFPDDEGSWIDRVSTRIGAVIYQLDDRLRWVEIDLSEAPHLAESFIEAIPARSGWALIRLKGMQGLEREWVYPALHEFRDYHFFYLYQRDIRQYEWSSDQLKEKPGFEKQEIRLLKERWSQLDWIADDVKFNKLLDDTRSCRLPAARLESMLESAMQHWERFIKDESLPDLNCLHSWRHWVEWLTHLRAVVRQYTEELPYSQEVTGSIMKATAYIRNNLHEELHLPKVARTVGMSRSYFSLCFREIIGQTFHDYVRELRIERAKSLLLQTSKRISWVAAQSGYPNDKYFSKVFREVTGLLPSEFRNK